MRKLTIIAALCLIAFVGGVAAQTASYQYRTTKPKTGALAVGYEWTVCSPDTATCVMQTTSSDTTATLTGPTRQVWHVRVRAFDAQGRRGPWSVASLPNDPGAPGGCGRPWR